MKYKIALPLTGLLMLIIGIVIGMSLSSTSASPSETVAKPTPTFSAYVSLLDTEIRGLDQETIEGYLTGKGLGQALPAELNGYPGPRHTIDMAEEMELTEEQLAQVQSLFDDMLSKAISLGEQYLLAVAELEMGFRNGLVSEEYLQTQLEKIAAIEAQLRYVHLSTHLVTIEILTQDQIAQYGLMRGYTEGINHQEMDHSE